MITKKQTPSDAQPNPYGGPGRDRIEGGSQDGCWYGDRLSNTIYGGPGNDIVSGNLGPDQLLGGAGDDRVFGCPGDDQLDAGQEMTLPMADRMALATPASPSKRGPAASFSGRPWLRAVLPARRESSRLRNRRRPAAGDAPESPLPSRRSRTRSASPLKASPGRSSSRRSRRTASGLASRPMAGVSSLPRTVHLARSCR
jgi:Ca2+-binding RTX toxin-like protein